MRPLKLSNEAEEQQTLDRLRRRVNGLGGNRCIRFGGGRIEYPFDVHDTRFFTSGDRAHLSQVGMESILDRIAGDLSRILH